MTMLRYSLLFTLFCSIVIASCISSATITDEKRFGILFQAENIGEDLIVEQDTLNISEFKFSLGSLTASSEEGFVFETVDRISALIFGYTEDLTGDRLIIEVGLGLNNDLAFNSYTMFLEPVENRSTIFDDDFFGSEENYSIVIKGTVGEQEFEFKSSAVFDKEFTFNRVELDETTETLVLRKTIDLFETFTTPEGALIDPRLPENENVIVSSIQENLELQALSQDLY